MASIRVHQAKSGPRYQVMYRIDKQQVTDSFTNPKGAAEYKELVERIGGEAAREILRARRGSKQAGRIPTVAKALTNHIDNLSGVTEGTKRDYRKIADRIAKSALGPLPLDAVTRDAVRRWVASQKNVSAKTVRNRHSLLFAMFEQQAEDRVIPANPCRGVRIGRSERHEMTILTRQEFWAVVSELDEHWRPLAVMLVTTGMRFGEATALQIRDLDLSATPPNVRIARAWKHTDTAERELGPPKTEKGRRVISLPPETVTVILPLLDGKHRESFLFVNKRGAPIRQNSFHEIWTTALDDADIGKRPRIHDLRHTHASWQIAQGVPLNVVQYRLGHTDIRTTVNLYSHLMGDAQAVAAQAASMSLGSALPELVQAEQASDAGPEIDDGAVLEAEA